MKKTNRFIALLTALVLVFSTMINSVAFAAVNPDVVGTDFEVAVGKLKAVGVMEGYPDGTFKPEGEITRAEFAKIAVVAMGLGNAAEASKGMTKFGDVTASHWASGYINLAVNRGLVAGYPDGTYKPEGKLTNAEAITILCRMIGLGPVIDKEGTWPANYVGRASNEGLLKGVNVASGTNALRGLVAKMLVNTLSADMWGATVYKTDGTVEYGVVAGTLLSEKLNVTETEDVRITSYDTDDKQLNGIDVAEGAEVDYYGAYRNEVTLWENDDDEIIYAEVTSKSFIDAVEVNLTDDEVKLIGADKTYDLHSAFAAAADSDVNRAGAVVDGATYDLAKVVVDKNNKVVFIDAYTFVDFMVVDSVSGNVIKDVEGTEINVKDYQLMKNGSLAAAADVVKGDIIAYNSTGDGFAEIYTKSVAGAITNIYSDGIKVAGKTYDFNEGFVADVDTLYLNEDGDLAEFDTDAADQMKDEGDVTLFLDREGKMLYVTGKLGDVESDKVANILISDVTTNVSFGEYSIKAVVVNQEGKKVTKTIALRDLEFITLDNTKTKVGDVVTTKIDYFDINAVTGVVTAYDENDVARRTFGDAVAAGGIDSQYEADSIMELYYDANGNVVGLGLFTGTTAIATNAIIDKEDGDKYAATAGGSYKILNDTMIFDITDGTSEDDTVINEWSKATDVKTIAIGATLYVEDGEVLYIVSNTVASVDDSTDVTGLVATRRLNADADKLTELKAWVNGVEVTYTADVLLADLTIGAAPAPGTAYTLSIDDATGKINDVTAASTAAGVVQTVDTSAKEITIAGTTYKAVSGFKVIDITEGNDDGEVINLVDVKKGNTVTVVREDANADFIEMIIVTDDTESADVTKPTVVSAAFTSATNLRITFDEAVLVTDANFTDGKFLDSSNANNPETFTIDAIASGNGTTTINITVTGSVAIDTGDTGTVDIAGVTDIVGNVIVTLNDQAVTGF